MEQAKVVKKKVTSPLVDPVDKSAATVQPLVPKKKSELSSSLVKDPLSSPAKKPPSPKKADPVFTSGDNSDNFSSVSFNTGFLRDQFDDMDSIS